MCLIPAQAFTNGLLVDLLGLMLGAALMFWERFKTRKNLNLGL
jgi:hypothetical protein